MEETADFFTKFAHQAIDEGADVFVGHGSHFPMGIEIYKGKPIFYSVGNFVFQNETVGFFPADAYERFDLDLRATPSDFLDARTNGGKKGHPSDPAYWENMFAVCKFAKNKLKEIRIHAIDQGFARPRPQRGRPLLAEGEVAKRVIERVMRLSRRYGTIVSNRNGVGCHRALKLAGLAASRFRRFNRSSRSSPHLPSKLLRVFLPRDAGEDEGGGLNDLNDWNVLNGSEATNLMFLREFLLFA